MPEKQEVMCSMCSIRSESDIQHICGFCVQLLLETD